MTNEDYPCYVKISEENDSDESVELPTEKDGTMLLTTVRAQFPDAIGLRFKSESGAWRGVRMSNDGKEVLDPPLEGWGYNDYIITLPKADNKRKDDSSIAAAPRRKKGKKEKTDKEMLSDLVVLNLSYEATEDDMKTFFEKYGELDMYQLKVENESKKSRGFGFIRYKTVEAVKAVLAATPVTMMDRKVDIRFPQKKNGMGGGPMKLFVGRLPGGTTTDHLKEHFSEYGEVSDAYIPAKFSGYGFVTMEDAEDANQILRETHIINGQYANVGYPSQKDNQGQQQQQNMGMMQQQNYGYGMKPGYGNQGLLGQGSYGNQGGGGYGNQGGGAYGNQGGSGYGNQGGGGYGNQGGGGYGNNMNNSYTSGYSQMGGKMQGGKTM